MAARRDMRGTRERAGPRAAASRPAPVSPAFEARLSALLEAQAAAFRAKVFAEEEGYVDPLMTLFSVTPAMKRKDAQYWGRELGALFEKLCAAAFEAACPDYGPPVRVGDDEPADFTACGYAIDTKYRIGSGDSGTLKKLRANAAILRERGFEPLMLVLRSDSLKGVVPGLRRAGWRVLEGDEALAFLVERTGFDLAGFAARNEGAYAVD